MTKKNVLTYAIRDADKIVWEKTVSKDNLTTVYVSNAPVYVPYGKYKNVIIGDSTITLSILKSALNNSIINQLISNSVIFYENTPIKGESIIFSNLNKSPIIQKILGSKDKYNIFFQNETYIDGRADFINSLGDFNNWIGSAVVEYKDNVKYFAVTYTRYVGAINTKIQPLFEIENFLDLEWVELGKKDFLTTYEVKNVKLILPNSSQPNETSLIAEIRSASSSSSSSNNSTVYSLFLNTKFPEENNGLGSYLKARLDTVPFSAELVLLGGKTYKINWKKDKTFLGIGSRDAIRSNYIYPLNITATVNAKLVNKNLFFSEQFGVDLMSKYK